MTHMKWILYGCQKADTPDRKTEREKEGEKWARHELRFKSFKLSYKPLDLSGLQIYTLNQEGKKWQKHVCLI